MAVVWHRLGLDHPLVQELDAVSRQLDENRLLRQRLRRGLPGRPGAVELTAVELADDELAADELAAAERCQLQQRRRDIEEQLRHAAAATHRPSPQEMRQLLATKKRAVTNLQAEIAALQKAIAASGQSAGRARRQLSKQLSAKRDTDAAREAAG